MTDKDRQSDGLAEGAGTPVSAPTSSERQDPPIYQVSLQPHRSFGWRGLSVVLGIAGFGLALPLIGLARTQAAWGMLPFLLATLLALYFALKRNYTDARLRETLSLWPDCIRVVRYETDGRILEWSANPYWVTVRLHENARIEKYLTLRGNGREIELGAFLSPWEREAVHDELETALARLRNVQR